MFLGFLCRTSKKTPEKISNDQYLLNEEVVSPRAVTARAEIANRTFPNCIFGLLIRAKKNKRKDVKRKWKKKMALGGLI